MIIDFLNILHICLYVTFFDFLVNIVNFYSKKLNIFINLDDEINVISERLHKASMILLVHIYLQWTSLIELLARKENGSSKVNKIQMYLTYYYVFYVDTKFIFNIRESVTQRLRDPLLLGSATILAASKLFCYGINPQIHDKVSFC